MDREKRWNCWLEDRDREGGHVFRACKSGGQIDGGSGLPYPAFLICDGNYHSLHCGISRFVNSLGKPELSVALHW